MGQKINCWEYRNCGMEPDGIFSKIHGECPIPKMMKLDGINGGKGAGRACWTVVHSSTPGDAPIPCRNSRISCIDCEFYHRVQGENIETADEVKKPQKILA